MRLKDLLERVIIFTPHDFYISIFTYLFFLTRIVNIFIHVYCFVDRGMNDVLKHGSRGEHPKWSDGTHGYKN